MKMKIMRFCLPALLAALGLTGLLSQPVDAGQVITLEQALEISLQKNPTLSASRSSVDAYKGKVTQAESAYYPQISGSVGYNRTYQDSSSASSGASTWDNGYSAGLSLSQYLYDFGKTNGLVEQSRQNLAASQHGYYSAASQLVRDVKSSYFDVLEGQHLLEVNQEYLDSQQRHLDQAKALYTQGLRPKIDVLTAETETSQARLSLVQAKYALRKYRTNLEKYLGGPPAKGEYALKEAAALPDPPKNLEPLISQAQKRKPAVAQAEANWQAATAYLKSVVGSYLPSLNAVGQYTHSATDFPLDAGGLVGVELSWDIFTGYKRTGQESEARAEIKRLKSLVDEERLVVTQEVTQAYLGLKEAQESIKTAEVGVRQAKENLEMARGRYKEGESNAIEFNDAQISYTKARSSLVQATYAFYKAWAELEYAMGGDGNYLDAADQQNPKKIAENK